VGPGLRPGVDELLISQDAGGSLVLGGLHSVVIAVGY